MEVGGGIRAECERLQKGSPQGASGASIKGGSQAVLFCLLGPGQNHCVYLHPKTQKFMFLPWDQDQTFGQFPREADEQGRENLSIHKPWSGEKRFLDRVFKTEAFKKTYLAKLREFNDTILKVEPIHRQVDDLANALRPGITEESADRLAELNRAAAGERAPSIWTAWR